MLGADLGQGLPVEDLAGSARCGHAYDRLGEIVTLTENLIPAALRRRATSCHGIALDRAQFHAWIQIRGRTEPVAITWQQRR